MINVLIVDDSITIRAMLTHVLQSDKNIRVAAAESAAEADEMLDSDHFDVITLDQEMPDMPGLAYLAILRERHDAPVIMLSSSAAKGMDLRATALMAGAVGVFDKAEAVRKAHELIKLVKDAAHRSTKIQRDDALAIRERLAAEIKAEAG